MIKETNYKPINLGIFAHVDAGKTTITENILYKTGVINNIGRVDDGNTQTDSMQIERRRGISIKSVTTSFFLDDIKINLIDTPGHIDFIAEVERVLNILDIAILVISGKEGVQTQTKVLWSALRKLGVPTIIFINKLDRIGVNLSNVVTEIKQELSEDILILEDCINEGTKDIQLLDEFNKEDIIETLANNDNELLEKYLNNVSISEKELYKKINTMFNQGECFPTFLGSALIDIGVDELLTKLKELIELKATSSNKLSGLVFKIDRDEYDFKIAYIRIFEGELNNRSTVEVANKDTFVKIKNLKQIVNGKLITVDSIFEGDIAVAYGLDEIEIGDVIGDYSEQLKSYTIPKTLLCSKILPVNDSDIHDLVTVLTELSEQDPLLGFTQNPITNELSINMVGQIQMEVIKTLLIEKYNIDVELSNPEVIYKERPITTSESIAKFKDNHPFEAEVGIKVEPLPIGSGIVYKSDVTYGYILKPFQNAVREAVFDTLKEGLHGWEVTDILVTFNHAYYSSVTSTPSDFRKLTPIVLMEALEKAKTSILEPRYDFTLKVKEDHIGKVMYDLQKMRAEYEQPIIIDSEATIKGMIPIETSHNYRIELASFTKGKGIFETTFAGYYKPHIQINETKERSKVSPLVRVLYIKSL